MVNVNDSTFTNEVLNSVIPVMVYFNALWVNECSLLTPVIMQIAQEMRERIKVVSINADENDIIVQRYNIKSMPEIFLFRSGKIEDYIIGTRSKSQLLDWISSRI